MTNFNTYQTRHLYVAKAVDSSVDTNLDIAVAATENNEFFYFKYKNADGLVTRSDLINPCWIRSVKKTAAADMAKPLMLHTVTLDSNVSSSPSTYKGATVSLTVDLQEYIDYSPSSGFAITGSIIGDDTNTANATAFYLALAKAIYKAIPKREYPLLKVYAGADGTTEITDANLSSVAGYANGVVLGECAQKYVRGKLNGDPIPFTVGTVASNTNVGDIAWGTDAVTVNASAVVPEAYIVADLEYFALGERGDVYRGSIWPNNFEPTYAVDLSKTYDIVTVEYYWQGTAENVQKSPRMIQIACEVSGSGSQATSAASTIYDAIQAIIANNGSGSGSGA